MAMPRTVPAGGRRRHRHMGEDGRSLAEQGRLELAAASISTEPGDRSYSARSWMSCTRVSTSPGSAGLITGSAGLWSSVERSVTE